jgi:DNA-directed RNA polymerase specialized sigma24 family protein
LAGVSEDRFLTDARRGDEAAFEQLIERHRGEVYARPYRMLGSIQDAEDALQESLLGAWRGLAWPASMAGVRCGNWLSP